MATDTLNINAIDEGWTGASGAATDIDETIAGADGSAYGPGGEADPADFGLTSTVVVDSDTVSRVDITVRLRRSGTAGQEQADVQFLVGGLIQGSTFSTGNLTTSFADYGPFNSAGWNNDWTQAQLNGAQIRLTPTQSGKPGTNAVDIDCADVVVTYTGASATPPPTTITREAVRQSFSW